jgi:hypothetical protein
MIDSNHTKDQQDIADAFNNHFSFIIDKISKTNVYNKTNNEKVPTLHYYLEQNYVYSPHLWLLRHFQPRKLLLQLKH